MSPKSRGPVWVGAIVVAALAVVAGVVAYTIHNRRERRPVVVAPTTAPIVPAIIEQSNSTTHPGPKQKPQFESTYMDVVRSDFPTLPTTQPLVFPLELSQAARLVFKEPLFLSRGAGDLWITRPDAPPTQQVLKDAVDPGTAADAQTHVLHDRVAFVDWLTTQTGNPIPYLVCETSTGGYEVVSTEGRNTLPTRRDYRWDRAFGWDDKVVVPTSTGISVLQFRPELKESYRDLIAAPVTETSGIGSSGSSSGTPGEASGIRDRPRAGNRGGSLGPTSRPLPNTPSEHLGREKDPDTNSPEPQALPDGQGLLTWIPWEHGRPGSRGAVRYLDGKWIDLGPDQSWPEKIVHLVPLRDGTVFQFVLHDDGSVGVETMPLEGGSVDEAAIAKIVDKLSDPDPDERRKAVSELANYGPGAWPTLTKLAARVPPQARLLLKGLLKDQSRPTLSGMTLLGDRALQLAARLSDGGAVFYASQGISLPDENGDPVTTAPAWLSVRPGHFVELLSAALVMDLKPDDCHLDVVGDQWLATTDVRGPRLFYGNGFATLLRKDERDFSRPLGVDVRGRWLFRKPAPPGTAAETLVIDPHLPDPTPRLPVWNLAIAETVGWDKNNWPVVQNGAAYALTDTDWRPLAPDEKFFHKPEDAPSPAAALPLGPTTTSSTQPAPVGPPILVTPNGSRYFGGLTDFTVVDKSGRRTDWPLPAAANGSGPVTLIATKDGKLFLFNQPGRVLRIARTPGAAEPFKLEATFTRNVPNTAKPTRIWLDPAGRIDIVYDTRLAILFPDGYLPRSISEKMLDQGGLDAELQ